MASTGTAFAAGSGTMKIPRPLLALSALAPLLVVAGCNPPAQTSTSGASAVPAATSKPAEPARGYLRALHVTPGLGPLNLTANEKTFSNLVTYGNSTPFQGIAESRLSITAAGGDGKKVAGPMRITLKDGEDATILVTGAPGDVSLLPFKHKNRGPVAGKARIAFVHAARVLPAVDISIDGNSFRKDVKYGIATDYTEAVPGRRAFSVAYDKSLAPQIVEVNSPLVITTDPEGNVLGVEQPTPTRTVIPRNQIVTLTKEVDLVAGKVYTVAVFHDEKKLPRLRLLEDKFEPTLIRAKPAEE